MQSTVIVPGSRPACRRTGTWLGELALGLGVVAGGGCQSRVVDPPPTAAPVRPEPASPDSVAVPVPEVQAPPAGDGEGAPAASPPAVDPPAPDPQPAPPAEAKPTAGAGAGGKVGAANALRAKAGAAERRGDAGRAFGALAEAWSELQGATDPQAQALAAEIQAELKRLGQQANRDAAASGVGTRKDVPLISR